MSSALFAQTPHLAPASEGAVPAVAPPPTRIIFRPVRMITKIALLLLALLVVAILYFRFGVARISGPEARELVRQGALLLDVRSAAEFSGGHIDGAINIPIQELSRRMSELGEGSGPIVVYCESGGRSAMAKRMLERNGFEHVHDLGGIRQW